MIENNAYLMLKEGDTEGFSEALRENFPINEMVAYEQLQILWDIMAYR